MLTLPCNFHTREGRPQKEMLSRMNRAQPLSWQSRLVGDNRGWVVPPANDSKIYNDWASENRFRPGDTLRFKYKKDSVLEVAETEYKGCNSTRPAFFSNTGNSVYSLNHSGAFYFISGVSGHCLKGQRMIVKVLTYDESQTGGGGGSHSSAADFTHFWALQLASVVPLVMSCIF